MTTRRVQPIQRRRVQRRKVSWENLAFRIANTAAADITTMDLTPEPMQTTHVGVGTATVRRAILHFDFIIPNLGSTEFTMSFGIVVVTADGFLGGSVPDPETDFNQDWYYWTRRSFQFETVGSPAQASWDADIRSMRKLRGGYRLIGIVETPVNPDISITMLSMRLLWSQEP